MELTRRDYLRAAIVTVLVALAMGFLPNGFLQLNCAALPGVCLFSVSMMIFGPIAAVASLGGVGWSCAL